MTTFAPKHDNASRLAELDEGRRRAWVAYREGLRDLSGSDYETAEADSWDELQRRLNELEGERSRLTPTGPAR